MKLYVDGALDTTAESSSDLNAPVTISDNNAVIGVEAADHSNGNYEGYINDVAIWDRALTAPEVKTLYNDGHQPDLHTILAENLVAWYRMGDGDRSMAKIAVADGDADADGEEASIREGQNYTIISTDGTKRIYKVCWDASNKTTVATGDILVGASDTGAATHANPGDIAVVFDESATGTASAQYLFLTQLKAAIEHANGHNGKIQVTISAAAGANGAQYIRLTQDVRGLPGNTRIVEAVSDDDLNSGNPALIILDPGNPVTVTQFAHGAGDLQFMANQAVSSPTATIVCHVDIATNETIILISTDGTSVTYTAKTAEALGSNQFDADSTATATATSLKACIEHASGHNGKILVSQDGATLTLTQATPGATTTITETFNANATVGQFVGAPREATLTNTVVLFPVVPNPVSTTIRNSLYSSPTAAVPDRVQSAAVKNNAYFNRWHHKNIQAYRRVSWWRRHWHRNDCQI